MDEIRQFAATAKRFSIADYNVFIGDYAVERSVFADVIVLHDDRIANNCALSYLYATEKNGIFNDAFNHATVGNQGIAHQRVFAVFGRRAVTYLRIDVSVSKQLVTDVFLQ